MKSIPLFERHKGMFRTYYRKSALLHTVQNEVLTRPWFKASTTCPRANSELLIAPLSFNLKKRKSEKWTGGSRIFVLFLLQNIMQCCKVFFLHVFLPVPATLGILLSLLSGSTPLCYSWKSSWLQLEICCYSSLTLRSQPFLFALFPTKEPIHTD